MAVEVGAFAFVVAACSAFFTYLLARFPYDGLYGQDSYAYYYQARAMWREMLGLLPESNQLFSTQELYHWPVGYHLHLVLGFILAPGTGGGRALTLALAVGACGLLYLLAGRFCEMAGIRMHVLAGLAAGLALPLVATFTRMGISIMADVPALFWGLLGLYCALRAWPLSLATGGRLAQRRVIWAIGAGAALGLAVLTRYGSGLLFAPLMAYLVLRRYTPIMNYKLQITNKTQVIRNSSFVIPVGPSPLWFVPGFVLALAPQMVYILTHGSAIRTAYTEWVSGWSPGNILSTTTLSSDGVSRFDQPMWFFYLLQPLYDSTGGFLSLFYLPAILVGLLALILRRSWPADVVLGTLLVWWGVPALFLAGTPYQAHRFVLLYLPGLLILFGIGMSAAVGMAFSALRGGSPWMRFASGLLAAAVLLGAGAGVYQEQKATRDWVATQAFFEVQEQQVAALARQAAGTPGAEMPHAVTFGITAALYHYTSWPVLDLFNADEASVATFWRTPAPRLLVVPEESMTTQWSNTPSGKRWQWIRQHYALKAIGKSGAYTVYRVEDTP